VFKSVRMAGKGGRQTNIGGLGSYIYDRGSLLLKHEEGLEISRSDSIRRQMGRVESTVICPGSSRLQRGSVTAHPVVGSPV
jgi:hypothetical protein